MCVRGVFVKPESVFQGGLDGGCWGCGLTGTIWGRDGRDGGGSWDGGGGWDGGC